MALTSRAAEHALRTVFRRCLQCPNETPSCPSCGDNEYCSQILSSCTECASAVCVNMNGTPVSSGSSGSHTNTAAIAGGVVGGVAAILIITFIIWKYFLKGRRQNMQENWDEVDAPEEKGNSDFTMRRDARASTHTVASLASTVMTRASNIIQIAYIPGITNRSGPQSPGHLVPPVPPIPSAIAAQNRSPYSDNSNGEVFFVPGDLRGSTYSGSTGFTGDGRSSYARTSISPSLARTSVASTMYRNNAIVSPLPAQTIVRGKAAVVSVKSSNSGSPAETPSCETPPVPQIDFQKLESRGVNTTSPSSSGMRVLMPQSSDRGANGLSPSGSVRSVQTIGKPTALNLTKKKKSSPPSSLANEVSAAAATPEASTSSTTHSDLPDRIPITMRPLTEVSLTDEHGNTSQLSHSHMDMDSSDSDSEDEEPAGKAARKSQAQSPFLDSADGGLSTVIEEATKRASKDVKSGLAARRSRATSPFDDSNAVKEE